MTYDPNASRKGGARKRLVDEVLKQVERYNDNCFGAATAMYNICEAVEQYKKDAGK